MKQIITHFTDDDLYKFTMCCAVIDNFPRAQVKYTFTDRDDTVYPEGFAQELTAQIAALESVVITEEEIDFMRRRCNYIPGWFYTYLKGYRFNSRCVKAWQDGEGHLHVDIEGSWANTILLEVKLQNRLLVASSLNSATKNNMFVPEIDLKSQSLVLYLTATNSKRRLPR